MTINGKPVITILDYFFVLRPTLFFPVWTVFLAGQWASIRFDPAASKIAQSFFATLNLDYFLVCFLLTLLMGAIFIINQIEDVESDRLNNKLFLIANGDISLGQAYVETVILVVIATLAVGLRRIELICAFLMILLFTGVFYSVSPFRMKDRVWGSLFMNMMGAPLIFSVGWLVEGNVNDRLLVHAIPYGTAIASIFLLTTLPDIAGDQKAGKITFGVRYGIEKTICLALVFEILTISVAAVLTDWVIFIPAFISLPFFIYTACRMNLASVLRTIRYSVLFISLGLCVRYPVYLIFLVLNYCLARWYYRKRFNLSYPGFKI